MESLIYFGSNKYNYDWIHLLATYKEIVEPDDRVLEIGSSHLGKTRELASCCRCLVGLEKYAYFMPDKVNFKGARVRLVNGDWQNLKNIFKSQRFDVVIASHVIEHVENDLDCLNQTFAVLKKGGYFIFTTLNKLRLYERIRSLFKGERLFPFHEHWREYTEEDVRRLLSKSKFNQDKTIINGLVFGIHAGPCYFFIKQVPRFMKPWVNFWEVVVQKS